MAKKPTYKELEQRVKELEKEIADRKLIEEDLRRSEDRYRLVFENANDPIFIGDTDLNLIDVNRRATEVYGYTREEFLGIKLSEITVPEQREEQKASTKKTVEKGELQGDWRKHITKDSRILDVEFSASIINYEGRDYGISIVRNNTEKVKLMEKLRESEERFRSLSEQSHMAILIIQDDLIAYANQATVDLFEYSLEEIRNWKQNEFLKAIHPDHLSFIAEQAKKKQEGAETVVTEHSYRIVTKTGNVKWVHNYSKSILYKGKFADYVTLIDITKQKRSEASLRESEKKYRTVLEGNPDPVIVYDTEGKTVYLNSAFTHVFGWTLEECLERKMDNFIPAENWPETQMMIDTGWAGKYISGIESRRYTKKGDIVNVSVSALAHKDFDGNLVRAVVSFRDITEHKKIEALYQHAKKMEAIGILAGGVAHDLNNILSGIVSYPDLLLMQLPEDSPLRKPISTIQQSGKKAAVVVQDLLTLARRGVAISRVVNLNYIVTEYMKSPEHKNLRLHHPDIIIECKLESDILNILGSLVHLSKTIMNLVSNAAEAMPGGGKIFISTENRYIDRPIRRYDEVEEGDYVILTVSDSGTGLSPEDTERIFEPFYTKKVMGRSGTGLGMAVVWGTVKDHRGYIDIRSTEGKGTTFILYFPGTREETVRDQPMAPVEDYIGNGESILVVDDVAEQREVASGMLRNLGYSVTTVSSGEEAVEYMKDNTADLLLLDMIMDPGIDGLETYKRILELHPGQKAIITSGYTETKQVKEAQRLGGGDYVKKPYLLHKIGLAVRTELDKG